MLCLISISFVAIGATSSTAAGVLTVNPTSTTEDVINDAREENPEEFDETLEILETLPMLIAYLNSYEGFDTQEEVQVLATQFTPEDVQAFVCVLESGELAITVGTDENGNPAPQIEVNPNHSQLKDHRP